MEIGDRVKVVVSDPWDFVSPDGDNAVAGRLIRVLRTRLGEALLIETSKPFVVHEREVSYLLALHRHMGESIWDCVTVLEVSPQELRELLSGGEVPTTGLPTIIVGSVSRA